MKVQVPSRRTLPGRRPEVLLLDPTVGVDWFRFGEGWCNGKTIRPDEVEMRLYPITCVPDSLFERADCDPAYGPACRWCYPDPTPVNLIHPEWRGGWPPKHHIHEGQKIPFVSCPALEIRTNGDVSFQYDDTVFDFIKMYYTMPLVGVFFLNCQPSGTVRFETDHRPMAEHLKREHNLIPMGGEGECGNEAPCANVRGQLPDRCPEPPEECIEPECPSPYDPEYGWDEYPHHINIEYPCDADNS